jgi:transposase-like protein
MSQLAMPIKNWRLAMTRFMIEFEEQLAPYVK